MAKIICFVYNIFCTFYARFGLRHPHGIRSHRIEENRLFTQVSVIDSSWLFVLSIGEHKFAYSKPWQSIWIEQFIFGIICSPCTRLLLLFSGSRFTDSNILSCLCRSRCCRSRPKSFRKHRVWRIKLFFAVHWAAASILKQQQMHMCENPTKMHEIYRFDIDGQSFLFSLISIGVFIWFSWLVCIGQQ